MAKLTVSRLLEVSKLLSTEAGQQLQELITFVNDISDQTIRALRQGLTFDDNVNSKTATITLKDQTEQIVDTGGKTPWSVIPSRVISTVYGIAEFYWYMNNSGQLVVKIKYAVPITSPVTAAPASSLSVVVLMLFN